MHRLHLFELEDQAWFPATIRDLATDYLHFVQTAMALHRPMTPLIGEALAAGGTTRIVDLCSGGAGPLLALLGDLDAAGVRATATLTDLFPNIPAFERAAAESHGAIGYMREPVDARAVPRDLPGLRTLFNGFHHFHPVDAAAILRDAASAAQPIAVFELSARSLRTLLPILLTPVFVWLTTPFMRPFQWKRLLFTYLLPLVPLTCLWDGIVSQLRAYTPEELQHLSLSAGGMRWRAGYKPFTRGFGGLTYLVGCPAPAAALPRFEEKAMIP